MMLTAEIQEEAVDCIHNSNLRVAVVCDSDWTATLLTLRSLIERSLRTPPIELIVESDNTSHHRKLASLKERGVLPECVSVKSLSEDALSWSSGPNSDSSVDIFVLRMRSGTQILTDQYDLKVHEVTTSRPEADVIQFHGHLLQDGEWTTLRRGRSGLSPVSSAVNIADSRAYADCLSAEVYVFRADKLRVLTTLCGESELLYLSADISSASCSQGHASDSDVSRSERLRVEQCFELEYSDSQISLCHRDGLRSLSNRAQSIAPWLTRLSNSVYLVCDQRGWAFEQIAQRVAMFTSGEFDVNIVYASDMASDSASAARLLFPNGEIPKAIHFFWRFKAFALLESVDFHMAVADQIGVEPSEVIDVLAAINISTTVCDYLKLSPGEVLRNAARFFYVDSFTAVNTELKSIYDELPGHPGALFKLKDVSHIETTIETRALLARKSRGKKCRVAWVGNSNWGGEQSDGDHKGFHRIVRPLLKKYQGDADVEFVIHDRADRQLSHEEVLTSLMSVDILLCASVSEGTPLPVIEGMTLGCCVVSTDVGIVAETLSEAQQEFVVERSVDAFSRSITKLKNDPQLRLKLQRENISVAAKYQIEASREWKRYLRHLVNFKSLDSKALKHLLIERALVASEMGPTDLRLQALEQYKHEILGAQLMSLSSNWLETAERHGYATDAHIDEVLGNLCAQTVSRSKLCVVLQGTGLGIGECLESAIRSVTRLTALELLSQQSLKIGVGDSRSGVLLIDNASIDRSDELAKLLKTSSGTVVLWSSNPLFSALNECYSMIEKGSFEYGKKVGDCIEVDSERLWQAALWHHRMQPLLLRSLRSKGIGFLGLDVFQYRGRQHELLRLLDDFLGGQLGTSARAQFESVFFRMGSGSLANRDTLRRHVESHPRFSRWASALG